MVSTTVMNVDLVQILNPIGTSVVSQIQQNLAAIGQNASGKTSQSLRYVISEEGTVTTFQVLGREYFMTVETGRRATPSYKPSKAFVNIIQKWMQAKGLPGKAYGIALTIHQKGTKLFQAGGRKDVVSNVINEGLYNQIQGAVLKKFVNQYLVTIDNSNLTTKRV